MISATAQLAAVAGKVDGLAVAVQQIRDDEEVDLAAVMAAAEAGTKKALAENTVHVDINVTGTQLRRELNMSDWLRSVVRTVLPGAWAAAILWLASMGLPQAADWLASETVATKVVELAVLAVV